MKEVPVPIAARSSKSRVCSMDNTPVTGFRENSSLADSALIRYVTLEKRSESTACGKEEERDERGNQLQCVEENMCGEKVWGWKEGEETDFPQKNI